MKTAICQKCGPKPVSEFYRHARRGYQSLCKTCKAEYNKGHYLKDRKKYLSRARVRNKQYREEMEARLQAYLEEHPCPCGETDPDVLDFHHKDPTQKEGNIGVMVYRFGYCWDRISQEIKKCKVLCSNCHRRLHARQRRRQKAGARSG